MDNRDMKTTAAKPYLIPRLEHMDGSGHFDIEIYRTTKDQKVGDIVLRANGLRLPIMTNEILKSSEALPLEVIQSLICRVVELTDERDIQREAIDKAQSVINQLESVTKKLETDIKEMTAVRGHEHD